MSLLAVILILCLACGGSDTDRTTNDPAVEATPTDEIRIGSDEIAIKTPEPDLHREELDQILKRNTMLDGVTVNGIAVGGLTLDEARAKVQPTLDTLKKQMRVSVTLGGTTEVFSAETIPTTDDLDRVLSEAFGIVREDNGFDAVSREVEAIKANGRDFPVTLSFDETALKAAIDAFAVKVEVQPQNATVAYNKDSNSIDYIADVTGKTVDRDALVAALQNAGSGDTIEAPVTETQAEIKLDDIKSKYVLRSTMTTDYSSSNKNRKENIRHGAMDLLTGTVVHPGEVFSMNGCLGVRKNDGHWKLATAYQQGKHVPEYGGGVCQISTTLYNAAVMADMEIVFRQNHSMPVGYISKGLDATINSVGNIIDFKFKNSSKSDIIIIANATGKKLTVEIWGIPLIEDSNGEYDEIRLPKPVKTKTLKPTGEIHYEVDPSKPVGYKEKVADRQDGSVWESKKEYYLNGVLVKSEKLATSTYKAYAGEYIIGPSAEPTEEPVVTPTPTAPVTTPPASDPTAEPPSDTPTPTAPPTDPPTDPPTAPPTTPPADPTDDVGEG
jgi:Uncharacterized vancomycin resistance protein